MIKYLKHSEINKVLWDECITQSPYGRVYAYSWYLDIVCENNWDALVMGNYDAVMPIASAAKWGIQYIAIPPFTQQLGIFGKKENHNPTLVNDFIKAIPKKYKYIDLYLNAGNEYHGGKITERFTQVIVLDRNYDAIRANFLSGLKWSIKKAQKSGLEFTSITANQMFELFRENVAGKIERLSDRQLEILSKLLNFIEANKKGRFVGLCDGEASIVAGSVFLNTSNRQYHFKSATSKEGRKLGGTHLILDAAIKQAIGRYEVFDFSGSMIPGVSEFYKSFGSERELYHHLRISHLPWPIRLLKK